MLGLKAVLELNILGSDGPSLGHMPTLDAQEGVGSTWSTCLERKKLFPKEN